MSAGKDIKFLTVQLTACSSTFKRDACEKLQKTCSWYVIYVTGFWNAKMKDLLPVLI